MSIGSGIKSKKKIYRSQLKGLGTLKFWRKGSCFTLLWWLLLEKERERERLGEMGGSQEKLQGDLETF